LYCLGPIGEKQALTVPLYRRKIANKDRDGGEVGQKALSVSFGKTYPLAG
jgi:hypothetical protein